MPSIIHSADRVLIVGGGIAGLATAARLAQSGQAVTVLEQGRLGSGASTRNQGWLHSGALYAFEQPGIARLCYKALRATLEFCPDCVEAGHDGALFLLAEESVDSWRRAWSEAGIPHMQVPPTQVVDRVPYLATPTIQHAFLLPDRSIRIDVLLRRIADDARRAGAEIRPETGVARLLRVRDEICGAVTNLGEEITARLVILAANTHNLSFLPEFETVDESGYSLTSLKTHLIATAIGPSLWPVCLPNEDGFHHLPHPPGSVFGCGRWFPAAGPDDDQPDPSEFERIRDTAAWLFPDCGALANETVAWAGTTAQAVPTGASSTATSSAAWPVVIDHARQTAALGGVISIFPGRATLWATVAEEALRVAAAKLGSSPPDVPTPPWVTETDSSIATPSDPSERVNVFHCQKCGHIQRRAQGLQPPVCCDAVMVRVTDELFRRPVDGSRMMSESR